MISNSASLQKFTAALAQLTYPFAIQYFQTEASARFIVYVGGVLQNEGLGNDYTIAETAAVNGISPGGDLIFVAQPTVGEEILIKRFTPRTQPNTFVGTNFPADSVEKTFDRNLMISQEIQDELTDAVIPAAAVVPSNSIVLDWAVGLELDAKQVIMEEGGQYRATVDHIATTFTVDLNAGRLEVVGTTGIQGDIGDPGPPGPPGDDSLVPGPAGTNGTDGVDGIFSAIASPAEVLAATDNTKGMTPLRTKQAIDDHVKNDPKVVSNGNKADQNILDIGDLNSRLNLLESSFEATFGVWSGQQRIRNGQALALDISGLASGEGVGKSLLRDGDGTRHAEIMVSIERKTSLEHRFSSFKIIMQFVDGVWYIKRDKTHVLVDALEVDGVTISVNNLPGNEGQLQYISDLMLGVDDPLESNIKYKGVELSEV